MSKALVIKGADYSASKLKTVEYLIRIPCVSIALSESSLTLNTLESQTLTATILPEDCTDVLVWSSSDTNVASVEDGVLTINGLGTATITATCGEQSATCAVSVDNIEITAFEFGSAENSNGNDNFATGNVPSSYKKIYYADKIPLDSPRLRLSRNANFVGDFNLAPSILPNNVGSVRFTSTDVSGLYHLLLYNSKQASTSAACAAIVDKTRQNAPTNGSVDICMNVPETADSITMGLAYKTQYTSEDDVAEIVAAKNTKLILMHDTIATETET